MNFFKKFKNLLIIALFFNCLNAFIFAQEVQASGIEYSAKQKAMKLSASDILLVPDNESGFGGGYNLYVKKLPQVQSILLTETTRDPEGKSDSYAYRAPEYNPINGDEIRYLDGKPLVSEFSKYSLIDSTTENHPVLGESFRIYIPPKLLYGYEWTRHGEIEIGQGTFINIRTFEKPYADYDGEYMDSPFMFNMEVRRRPKEKPVVLDDAYNPLAGEKFKEISSDNVYSKGPETIVKDIVDVLGKYGENEKLDVVLAIDTTGSMKDDMEKLKKDLIPAIQSQINNSQFRVGLLFYRDYGDNYSYKGLPVCLYAFTSNLATVNKNLNAVKILGREGGDIPEAVYEAIFASTEYFKWREDAARRIILIGDAEPHPTPRGTKKYSKEYVLALAALRGIEITTILVPDER